MTDTPVFTRVVLGFRTWLPDSEGRLWPRLITSWPSAHGMTPWQAEITTAACDRHNHHAPDARCLCGLHAWHDFDDARRRVGSGVLGAVAAWGELQIHSMGFRAEKACVLGLADLSQRRRLSQGKVQRLARAATRHDVPILDADELIVLAARSAAPIDASQPLPECASALAAPAHVGQGSGQHVGQRGHSLAENLVLQRGLHGPPDELRSEASPGRR